MELMRAKVSGAMEGASGLDTGLDPGIWAGAETSPRIAYEAVGTEADAAWQPPMGAIAREFHAGYSAGSPAGSPAVHISGVTAPTAAPARSMAETLQGAFGTAGETVPAHVREAYAKLARFGL
jgi:hypothetical protein